MTWRNLTRRKRRTLISAFTIAGGVFFSVAFTATGDYAYTNMINTSATMGFGHVTVEPAGYNLSPTLQKRISGAGNIRDKALETKGVTDAIVRITGQAMFASAAKSVGGVFIGIDPSQESTETNIYLRSLEEGSMFDKTDGRQIVIGRKMAKRMNLRIGKKLVYTTTDIDGEIVSEVGRISGIFKTGVDGIDSSIALIPIDKARSMLRYGPDEATLISVFIDDQRFAGKMRDVIASSLGTEGIDILTWSETQADMAGIIAIDRRMNRLSQFLVGLLIAAGILNTMFMSVLERKREFGIMMAVGMSPGKLFGMVLLESFWLGLLGLAMGVVITIPAYIYMTDTGIDLSSMIEDGADVGGVLVDPIMKYRLYKESVGAILSGVFTLTILAGLYPAFKAGRVAPVENLKVI